MKTKILLSLILLYTISTAQPSPYVLLVSFDGFRWDYLNRDITPNLDQTINDGVRALSLEPITPSKTFPNHYSIVTGMYAEKHGLIFNTFEDSHSGEMYKVGDTISVRDPKWYKGEAIWETLENCGIVTASFYWPGSEVSDPKRRPTYFKHYQHGKPYKDRIDGVMDWLQLPYKERPKFITLYFHDTDSFGHTYGPNSPELNESIKRIDSLVGYINDQLVFIGMKDSLNVIYVSDHGMTEIDTSRVINISRILNGLNYQLGGTKPILMIEPNAEHYNSVYNRLKMNESHYTVYKRENIPEHFHFKNNKNIYSLLVVAEIGWSLVDEKTMAGMKYSMGNHGYLKEDLDMHGILVATGPNLKSNFKTGTLRNIDIYPLLCEIYGVHPNPQIDGELEKIEFILKEKDE